MKVEIVLFAQFFYHSFISHSSTNERYSQFFLEVLKISIHLIFDVNTIDKFKRVKVSYGFLCVSLIIFQNKKTKHSRRSKAQESMAWMKIGKSHKCFSDFKKRQIVAF